MKSSKTGYKTIAEDLTDNGVDSASAILFVADMDTMFKKVDEDTLKRYGVKIPLDKVKNIIAKHKK